MALEVCTKCGKQFSGNVCPCCEPATRSSNDGDLKQRRLAGLVCIALSSWIAFEFYKAREPVLLIAAAIFFLGGAQLVTNIQGKISALMAGLACAGLSTLGFVAAFSRQPVRGGIPFIPRAWNQALGHTLFGVGAVLTAAMGFWFIYRAFKPRKRQ